MQLYLKKILNYLFLLIFIFIIINLLISISWQIYSKLNKKPNAYNQKQLELLNLSNLDSEKLFRETYEILIGDLKIEGKYLDRFKYLLANK